MKVWQIQDTYGIEHLKVAEKPDPKPGPRQIVVAMRAVASSSESLEIRGRRPCVSTIDAARAT